MSEMEKEEKKNLFINFKFLEDVKETTEYKNAKERIELIEDIFSINEEKCSQVIKKLKEYLQNNEEMVQMFILVISIFISTRFKAAKKFGKILLDIFMNDYKEKIISLNEFHENLNDFNSNILKGIYLKYIVKDPSFYNGLTFYDYDEGSIEYFLLNDDIKGLQNYLTQQIDFDFQIKLPKYGQYVIKTVLHKYKEPTYFDYSILFGALKCFKFILKNDDVNISICHNFYAVASGNFEIIHILEQINNNYDQNCFSACITFHHNEIFQWLVRNYVSDLVFLNAFITESILCCNEEIFYFILNNGGYLNTINDSNLSIKDAIYTLNIPFVKYLYEKCQLNSHFDYNYIKTLLNLACNLDQLELVEYFIDIAEKSMEQKNSYNIKDLYVRQIFAACKNGHLSIVEFFINRSAHLNLIDKLMMPILAALYNKHYSIVTFLCEHTKFNMNFRDEYGMTILHWACHLNDLEMVKYIVQHGSDPNTQDYYGNIPYFYTTSRDIKSYIKSLKNFNSAD